MSLNWTIWVDGASSPSKGTEGPAGAAFIARSDQGDCVEVKRFLRGTISRAEVLAILLALEWAFHTLKKGDRVTIYSDSTFAVFSVAKVLGLNYLEHNQTQLFPEMYADILSYYHRIGGRAAISFAWIPREQNKEADKLAKAAKEMEV